MFTLNVDEFWDFSLAVYKDKAVKDACLELQDSVGLNVNIILAMMYLCSHKRKFAFEDTQKLAEAIAVSDQILQRFRKKCRGIKEVNEALYKKALQEELQMEKAQQRELVEFANTIRTYHLRRPNQLTNLLVAMCLRQLTLSSPKHRKRDNRILSDTTLKACTTLGTYLDTDDFYAQK